MGKILIVDDESHIRLLLEQTLEDIEEKGVKIITANNGKKAVDIILTEKPDLVFLDLMMPELNGYDVCNLVKKEHGMDDIYIVMLTAKGQEYDKRRGFEAGADIYITKPFDPDFILDKAVEVFKNKGIKAT